MKITLRRMNAPELLFFIMMWVFYSLNSRFLQIPGAILVRWAVLGILILYVLVRDGKVASPPLLIIVFVLATFPSVFPSIDKMESIVKILSFVVVSYGTYIYFSSLETKEELEFAMKTIMAVVIAFEIQSVVVILMGQGYMGDSDRAVGITTNANTLGGYSNLAALAAFYWWNNSSGKKRLLWICLLVASAFTALLSGSRTAFATLFLLISLLLLLKNRGGVKTIAAIIAIAVLAWLVFSGRLAWLNLRGLNGLLQEGGSKREALWELGIDIWKRFPYFGCGYSVSSSYNTLADMESFDFHSSYITFLAENGLWGIVLFGSALVVYGIKAVPVLKPGIRNKETNLYMICCLMMLVQLISAYSESFLFAVGSTEACTFWTLLMWSVAYRKKWGGKQHEQ